MTLPWNLDYWKSGEYQTVREKLDDESAKGFRINPERKNLFRALALTPEREVRCAIIGQDPYPSARFATGLAFSLPADVEPRDWPPTFRAFITEYSSDLGYTSPSKGTLEKWCSKGVLLWNAIPSCREGSSLSHNWPTDEWYQLTAEIIQRLNSRGIVFIFVGAVAKRFINLVDARNKIIVTGHPSPRGSANSRRPWKGSRPFSTANDYLNQLGLDPIDWRLDGSVDSKNLPRSDVAGSRILPNITGALLGGQPRHHKPNLAASTTFKLEGT